MTKASLLAIGGLALLHAQQPVSYGVKIGTPLNDSVSTTASTSSSPGRWTGGPFVELHLPLRLSLEFSALYRSGRENATRVLPFGQNLNPYLFTSTDKIQTWDFPLLLKYRFGGRAIRPFVGAGAAWSYRRSQFEAVLSCLGVQDSCRPPMFSSDPAPSHIKSSLTRFGPAASAGFDIKTRAVTISPEVRWNRAFSGSGVREQFSVLVGLGF
ncbi:MAG: outer membrane beta-barrel protein [Acidobacteria bacterium]|nr:outer membrane beta-barrel protein [Acidobacteriota bacterium]